MKHAISLVLAASLSAVAISPGSAQPVAKLQDLKRGIARLKQGPPLTASPNRPAFPFKADAARTYQKAYANWIGLPLEWKNDLGMTFVLVPPGTFLMGSPADEPGHSKSGYDEAPRHQVRLTRAFYLSKHETTVGQFRAFVKETKYVTDIEKTGGGNAHDEKAVWKHKPGTTWLKPGYAAPFQLKDEHPVVHVSHTDAKEFCRWLQKREPFSPPPPGMGLAANDTGLTVELPTEAEWEWACRAGSGDRFWWGPDEDTTGKVANVGDKSLKKVHPAWPRTIMPMDDSHAYLAPVGSYRPNAFGLHDMLGNVWEFCSTRYAKYPKGPRTDPLDGDPKRGFAVRGGGWSNIAADVRCASRNADPPHFGHSNLGFRVAVLVPLP